MPDEKKTAFDLTQVDTRAQASEGAELHLHHPVTRLPLEHEGVPMTITLYGSDSKQYRQATHRLSREHTKGKRGDRRIDPAELESAGIELMVAVTKTWSVMPLAGELLAPNEHNYRKVYTDFPWIVEQVDEFLNDRTNYLGN